MESPILLVSEKRLHECYSEHKLVYGDFGAFKLLINEAIGGLPALPKDMEKNNDSIYTNHQGAERTDK